MFNVYERNSGDYLIMCLLTNKAIILQNLNSYELSIFVEDADYGWGSSTNNIEGELSFSFSELPHPKGRSFLLREESCFANWKPHPDSQA